MKKIVLILLLALTMINCSKNVVPVISYSVTFDADGGYPTPIAQEVEAGDKAVAPASPTKQNCIFLFWSLNGTSAYNFQLPVNSDITLQAKWEDATVVEYCQVSWELNGGSWPPGDNHATQVVKGGTLAEPNAPVKAGRTFDGWYKESTLINKVTFPYDVSNVTADFALYAKWEDVSKAGYFGTWRDDSAKEWDQFTIDADRILMAYRSGHTITIENLTWTEISNQSDFITNYPDVDYIDGYNISGIATNINGMNFIKEDRSGYAGVGDRVALNIYISADGKSVLFGMWTTESEEPWGPYSMNNVGHWQVTWNLDGGEWPSNDNHSVQVAKDGMLRAPASPTKVNNNFSGWYTASIDLITFPYDVSEATGNITFNARWTDSSPSVTLKVSVSPGAGFYASLSIRRISSGSPAQYQIPTSAGTHTINVSPGTYRVYYTYWACQTVNCMSSGWSSDFIVSSGQTKNISVTGSSVGL